MRRALCPGLPDLSQADTHLKLMGANFCPVRGTPGPHLSAERAMVSSMVFRASASDHAE